MRNDIYENVEDYISDLELEGHLKKDCLSCQAYFYPKLKLGVMFTSIHAPRHKPSNRCESGQRPHCTCDTCF